MHPMKDTVCGMTVTAESQHSLQHAGKPFYFCSAACKTKFAADPEKYLAPVSDALNVSMAPETLHSKAYPKARFV